VKFDDLGIVVIGRNEGQRLIKCLTSLIGREHVVVYVDSGSTDSSVSAAEHLGALVVKLDLAQPFTAARARNEGFKALMAARPDLRFVQFVDGDCELVPTWLDTALPFIANQKAVAVVCGRRREQFPERSVYNWLCEIEWNTPIGEALACGGDSLMRVDSCQEVGGFRPSLIAGEEPELCARLRKNGWKIWRLDADMTRHDAAMTRFSQWWLRAVRSGYAEAEVSRLHLWSGLAIREKRAVASAVVWGGLIPLAIILGALFYPVLLAGTLIYPIQIWRIAVRRRAMGAGSWTYAIFMTVAKFAQLQGNLKYVWDCWRGRPVATIEYK
jgi:glycosyltransferase involved in cell wall biosynthesis